MSVGALHTGGPEGLLLTNGLISVTAAPDGRTCVLDFPTQELRCGKANSDSMRLIAGEGPGPGELSFAGGVGIDPSGRLWVASGRGTYSVFDFEDGFIETRPRPSTGLVRRAYHLRFDTSGRVIDEAIGDRAVRFVRYDPSSGAIDSLASLEFPDRGRNVRGRPIIRDRQLVRYMVRNYLPTRLWAVNSSGHVWTALSGDLTLHLIDLASGDTLREVRTRHRPRRAIADDEQVIINRALRALGVKREDAVLVRPVVQSLHVDEADNVWVQVVDEVGQPGREWDVFDPSGVFLGTVDLGYGLPRYAQPAITRREVIGIALDQNDVPAIVWSDIDKPEDRTEN